VTFVTRADNMEAVGTDRTESTDGAVVKSV